MAYVDGFLLPLSKSKIKAYQKLAASAGKIWIEHGALDFNECLAEDLRVQGGAIPFSKVIRTKKNETVVFSYIVYKSRRDRDRVNAKVMADPRIKKQCVGSMPFDCKRMACGGFKVIAGAQKRK